MSLSRGTGPVMPRVARSALGLALLLGAWEGSCRLFDVPSHLLPTPSGAARTLVADAPLLAPHLAATALAAVLGLAVAAALGVALALAMHASRWSRDLLYPPLVLAQAVPLMAVAPLLIIWFGLGLGAKVFIVGLVCVFPVAVNAYEGFRTADPARDELLVTLGAGRAARYRHHLLPATLPGIFAGLRISATYSVLGAVVGEWLGGSRGLGVYMTRALQSFRTDRLFAAIALVMALSLALFWLVDSLGALATPWLHRKQPRRES
ncbi:MAG: ABC transporter permease [Candidatus Bipolaricaulota bacterium]